MKLTNTLQITKSNHGVPKLAVGILLALFGIGVFVVGFDQGHLFSMIEGSSAFDDLYLHELYHDMRHAAGYPCH
ncbi:MAG TPA: CbtB domain-containing protein [Nitrosopumilaceae archaeon]|nr:CbtB domain-containing protein [Nitrosopumilaceae archaeon]